MQNDKRFTKLGIVLALVLPIITVVLSNYRISNPGQSDNLNWINSRPILQSYSYDHQSSENDPQSSENHPQSFENHPQLFENDPQSVENDPQSVENDPQWFREQYGSSKK